MLSKYSPGDDGKIPYERIRNETCMVPLVPFGEVIMYLPLKTVPHSKGEPVKREGVHLGTNERIEESLIGTTKGVVKCRSLDRMIPTERWRREMILNMKGTIWEPVPGSDSQHVPVSIDERGIAHEEDDNLQTIEPIDDETGNDERPKANFDKMHVSQKALRKVGPTPGCQAFGIIVKRGNSAGRVGYNHNHTCRARIIELMKEDPEYRGLMQRQARHQDGQHVDAVTEKEIEEMQGRVRKAIQTIQRKMAREQENLSNRLNVIMMRMLINEIEVAEVYSPPRVGA